MRRLLVLAAALFAFSPAAEAAARVVVLRDFEGRPITFDVRVRSADVEWYARFLRRAAHGDEISRVTVRLVSARDIAATCGAHAGGCYGRRAGGRGVMVVPAEKGSTAAHTLLHEYAHHLDRSRGVRGVREPNGTAHWWQAREMERLAAAGEVAFDYSNGWTRAVSEIFAEDYARLHLELPYRIDWLPPPDDTIRAALALDVEGVPSVAEVPPPLVIVRRGTLRPGASHSVPFGLLGPGRRVTFSAQLDGENLRGARAQLVLRCSGRTVVRRLEYRRRSATIDERGLGPAEACSVELRNTTRSARRFTVRLTLTIER